MTHSRTDVLLIGGGVAAASVARTLRAGAYQGSVTLVSRELTAPYHRPPITKGLLRGKQELEEVVPVTWWSEESVELRLRSTVASLDVTERLATLADGSTISYREAVLATGAMVRRLGLDGASLTGIHYLRTPANAAALRSDFSNARNAVLIGGSFVAAEVAASLAASGLRCTMVMAESDPMERAFGRSVAGHVRNLLAARGIEFECNAEVTAFTGDERVSGVRTAEGREIHADLVVVGVGAVPDARLGRRAGLAIGPSGGIQCNARLVTSDPHHYAAGDICEYESLVHGRSLRVEHEEHAIAQGCTVGANLLGAHAAHVEVPYFWTDLGDGVVLEYVGPASVWDEEILWGSFDGPYTVWYLAEGRLVAALTCGRPTDLDLARALIISPSPEVDQLRLGGVGMSPLGG